MNTIHLPHLHSGRYVAVQLLYMGFPLVRVGHWGRVRQLSCILDASALKFASSYPLAKKKWDTWQTFSKSIASHALKEQKLLRVDHYILQTDGIVLMTCSSTRAAVLMVPNKVSDKSSQDAVKDELCNIIHVQEEMKGFFQPWIFWWRCPQAGLHVSAGASWGLRQLRPKFLHLNFFKSTKSKLQEKF